MANDPVFSRYHAKDDPYIQAGLLPLKEFRPEGLLLSAGPEDKYARGILAQKGSSAAQALIKKWAGEPDTLDVDSAATALWEFLTEGTKLLAKTTLRSQTDKQMGRDVWQVNAEKVRVVKSDYRERCAIYVDGMSRNLHGDPQTAKRDQIIRQALEVDGWEVIVVQSRDMDDPQAIRQHLRNIAKALGREELIR